jgi:hypothetical protein
VNVSAALPVWTSVEPLSSGPPSPDCSPTPG